MSELQLGLRLWPDPILTKKAEIVSEFGPELNNTIIGMTKLMQAADGAGLAGPQAGLLQRIVVWKIENEEGAWINPEIIQRSDDTQTLQEGCLSFPTIMLGVTRSNKVTVKFQNTDGETCERVCFGPMAQMAQHEIEHLDGKVFTYFISSLKRNIIERKMIKYKKKIMEIKKQYEQLIKQQSKQQQSQSGFELAGASKSTSATSVSTPDQRSSSREYDFSIRSESV